MPFYCLPVIFFTALPRKNPQKNSPVDSLLQKQSPRGKWCISQRLSRHTSKLYSLFVHSVTAHVKERFLDLLGWSSIDVLSSSLSFHRQPYDSCQVQVCFLPFLLAHKFFRWPNVDIIAQGTEI